MSEAAMREGTLITYKSGVAVGRERFRDDGAALVSNIQLGQSAITVTLTREPRRVRLDVGDGDGKSVERDVPAGAIVLENGSWEAYSLAASQFLDAASPVAVDVLIPSLGATVGGTIAVRPSEDGGRRVEVVIQGLQVEVDLDATGSVVAARVPAQGLEARREGAPAPALEAPRSPPRGVIEEAFEATREGVTLRGDLWLPASAVDTVPVVVILAGSGPTDRDGNSSLGLRTDAYRLVAEALAARGIASLRYDKRGVGKSGSNFDPATTVLDDFAADALAVTALVRADPRFSTLALLGHSEGGLLALMIAERAAPDVILLVAVAGRPLSVVLREQLARRLDPRAMVDVDRVLAAVRCGAPPDPIPAPLAPLFAPTVRAFLRSALDVDPLPLLRAAKARVAIVQGAFDAQVTPVDARLLAAARPDATLTILPTMNHVLKEEASAAMPQASYSDPSRPLAPGLGDILAAALR